MTPLQKSSPNPSAGATTETIYLGLGCFWGAEELLWGLDSVRSTAVGYMGGTTSYPTYEQVCTGGTGHAEVVRVEFEAGQLLPTLKAFWENHDPTSGDRQGNDLGSQYRSVIFPTTEASLELASASRAHYQRALTAAGEGAITTEIKPASQAGEFFLAEDYHQKYLLKNPNGYRCHARTGVAFPLL